MSELSTAENPKVPREQLLRNAERLFTDLPFLKYSVVVSPGLVEGRVIPEVEQAVKAEHERAEIEGRLRRSQKEVEWKQRSIGRVISDVLKRQDFYDFAGGSYKPKPNIGDIRISKRGITGNVPLDKGRFPLPVSILQSHFEGSLTVAGQEFVLDPGDSLLSVNLSYLLSDGTRTDLAVSHTLYPYKEEVDTQTHVIFGDNWSGVPHQPFTDAPTNPSVYMNEAIEMFIDGRGHISRYEPR